MNNLALSDYVNLDNKQARNKSILKMLIAFIILLVIYINMPNIGNNTTLLLVYIALGVLVVYLTHRWGYTFKIVKRHIKLEKITLIIFILLMLLWSLAMILQKITVFKMNTIEWLQIVGAAIFTGLNEEALFRGLLLNALIELFSKAKYVFVWSALADSFVFSMCHLVNLTHQSIGSTVSEMSIVMGLGLLLIYMRLITNNIRLGILFHTYLDISPQLSSGNYGTSDVKGAFIAMLVLVGIGLLCIYEYNRRFNKGIVKN